MSKNHNSILWNFGRFWALIAFYFLVCILFKINFWRQWHGRRNIFLGRHFSTKKSKKNFFFKIFFFFKKKQKRAVNPILHLKQENGDFSIFYEIGHDRHGHDHDLPARHGQSTCGLYLNLAHFVSVGTCTESHSLPNDKAKTNLKFNIILSE